MRLLSKLPWLALALAAAPAFAQDATTTEAPVEAAIEAIINAAKTGKIGDGKIFVMPVEQAIRIRTGETGIDAV